MAEAITLDAFLAGRVDAVAFRHADHVRIAYEALSRHPFLAAASAVSTTLRAMAARAGAPGAYHETITLAFLALIAERMEQAPHESYEAFASANPDLLDKRVLARWYGAKLDAPLARRVFVLPDPAP